MQLFPCPFCGPRSEHEFHYSGQADKIRPQEARKASAKEWSDYLYQADNPKGEAKEIWVHLTCQQYFLMTRDTVSMDVLNRKPLNEYVE